MVSREKSQLMTMPRPRATRWYNLILKTWSISSRDSTSSSRKARPSGNRQKKSDSRYRKNGYKVPIPQIRTLGPTGADRGLRPAPGSWGAAGLRGLPGPGGRDGLIFRHGDSGSIQTTGTHATQGHRDVRTSERRITVHRNTLPQSQIRH